MKKSLKLFLISISALFSFLFFFQLSYYVKTFVYPPNMLLQKPLTDIFSPKDRLNRDWRKGGFNMSGSRETKKFVTIFMDKSKDKRFFHFIITYLDQLPDQLSDEQKKLFNRKTMSINNKPSIFYNYSTGSMPKKKVEFWTKKYNEMIQSILSKTKDKDSQRLKSKPQKIDVKKCSQLINGKTFMFYTGAGISVAAGIPSGKQLDKVFLGFNEKKPVDQLTLNILSEPEKVIAGQKKFEKTFRNTKPTKAHYNMAKIAFNNNAHIMTSNIDRLHEQSGIKSWPVMSSYRMRYLYFFEKPMPTSGNFTYLESNPQWLKDLDFVICVGMSDDVKGLLAWYKKHNPSGQIIAINTDEVSYLDDKDYFLQGDAQIVIPALRKELENIKTLPKNLPLSPLR